MKNDGKKWGGRGTWGFWPSPRPLRVKVNITDDRISLMELKVKLGRTFQRADLGLAFLGDGERTIKKKLHVEQ
jgi:hypothetical protein